VLEAIAAGKQRILLTLATGTGKTFIAFQIAWKLFQSRWNLSREPSRRPRILFLADRNILANQAYNAFSPFPEDAMVRIEPDNIRKKGKVPKNGSLFFTIFQTFMSGQGETPYFGEYPPDFFDFIVIDECHRGGANDESTWRDILTYFAPAVQLGLTATPKRRDNVDTYKYFGEPVYVYSLKDGINDGFLTPFKVKQISTTLDEYVYTPDDKLIEGEVESGKRYTEADFNKIIEIKEREAHRVKLFMEMMDQREKTLVFCATQPHALAVRDLINQMKTSRDPNYCQRVTADDGSLGEQHLRDFQDNEKSIPTILTTSQKLSTGVDARNIRNIVLMRPINTMVEFKQIIGRGTRLYDGKDYFTIYDFVKAYLHFSDPEWDGEPEDNTTADDDIGGQGEAGAENGKGASGGGGGDPPPPRPKKIKVKLADGKARTIQHMMVTTFWHPDGTPMSAQQFMEMLFGKLPEFFKDEAELRALWSAPDTRAKLLQGLDEKGFGGDQLREMQKIIDAEKSDLFDVLAYIAYALPTLSREERATNAKGPISTHFNSKQQEFLDFVLSQYVKVGVLELDKEKLSPLLKLKYNNAIADAIADLGKPEEIGKVFAGFQRFLYEQHAA
jgi:type I restriction enzyme, R subunit